MKTIVTVIAFSIFLFIIMKIIDMKFIQKEMKPFKEVIRESLMVGLAVGLSSVAVATMDKPVSEFMDTIMEKQVLTGQAAVFTDNPGF